jgi:hypothetical protein
MVEIPIRQAFSNRGEAEAARDRLEYGGFGRSRVQMFRLGDQFVVIIHASDEEESQHAQQLMSNTGWLPDWANRYGRAVGDHAPSPGQALAGFALIAGVGAALYWAFGRAQHNWYSAQRLGTRRPNELQGRRASEARPLPTAADIYDNPADHGVYRDEAGGGTRREEAFSSGRTRVREDQAQEGLGQQRRPRPVEETSPTMGNR